MSYIKKTVNIERKFFEHRKARLEGTHSNKYLKSTFNGENIESLKLFVLDYGLKYSNKDFSKVE